MDAWDDLLTAAMKHLRTQDAVMSNLIDKHGPVRLQPHTDYYGELVSAIIGQQLSEKAGATILKRFMGLFDGKLPSPAQLVAIDTEVVRGVGVSYRKVAYMKDLGQHIVDGRLDLAHIASLPNPEVIEQLTAVKGIGIWSAHMFMIFCLGRLDVLPWGDLGIRKATQTNYKLKDLPDQKTMEAAAKKHHWSPYESVASWYLWADLDNKA